MSKLIIKYKKSLTFISGILLVVGLVSNYLKIFDIGNYSLILATIVALIPISYQALSALYYRAFSIDLLVMIAAIGALLIKEYIESSVVTFLFLFGAYLEAKTLAKTRSSLQQLLELAPTLATRKIGDKLEIISIVDINLADTLVVKAGEKIPVDGEVVRGSGDVNQATITGESRYIAKEVSDFVYAGTILESGYLELKATKIGKDTTFSKIIELVRKAQNQKSDTQKFLDRFAQIYTPSIVILAILVYLFTFNLHLAITFLVVACPGALVIGAPVATVAGIGNGAANGLLFKGGEVMEKFSKVETIIFDKTGTLTKGNPQVNRFLNKSDYDDATFFSLIASAELLSEHHLARAIIKYATEKGYKFNSDDFAGNPIKGRGIIAANKQHEFIIGNQQLVVENSIVISEEFLKTAKTWSEFGETVIYVVIDKILVGLLAISDPLRDDAVRTLNAFKKLDIKNLIMLTGDNQQTAQAIAANLPLTKYYGELLPEEKVSILKDYQEKAGLVLMIGDGVNDAPAIATADVGVSLAEVGSDVTLETADLVLMSNQLSDLSKAYQLANQTTKVLMQNTIFALATVVLLLIGILFQKIHLASGMLVHEASIFIVIFNAMRLLRFQAKMEV